MFLFLKKKADDEKPESGGPTPASEFIPYYCHWDAHTLLTKNGELMQTVRITANQGGLNYESGESAASAVREKLRAAIAGAIDSDKFAVWIHTIRKRRRVHYPVQFKEGFAAWVHELWQKKKHWKYQYYNEIYLSILHEGQAAGLLEKDTLSHMFSLKRNRQHRASYLEEASAELDRTVEALMNKLRPAYDAYLLAVAERLSDPPLRQVIFYSEPMEFLGQIINLRSESFPVTEADASKVLADSHLTFGFNALETKKAGKRRFAALLTLKQYCEAPSETIDRVLQAPMEFVVSEAFSFIPAAKALKPYKEQSQLFEISGDAPMAVASGLDDILSSDKGRPVDFGEHQISIMVLGDDYRHLDSEVAAIQEGLGDFGLIPIREDLRLEECFWSQLPGNFEFLRRKSAINTARIGGFCRLNRFAAGSASGNHWGPAVTVAPTIVNSPYFFNFHCGDNGHTALFNFNSFHDHVGHVLLNFLLAETRKYDGRLYIFDRDQSSRLFFTNLGGNYHTFSFPTAERHASQAPAPSLKLNPFTLEDNPRNRSFLLAWVTMLLAPLTPSDAQNDTLRTIIAQLYAAAPAERNLSAFVTMLAAADPVLAKALSAWHGSGATAHLFDGGEDGFNTSHLLHAFDMTQIVQNPATVIPIFSYLMHRLIASLDGRPTIIVLHEAWDLIENAFFAPRLESLLAMLKQHNAMVIFATGKPLSRTGAHSFDTIMKNCPTRLYIPDDVALDYASQNLELSDSDAHLLRRMERQKGDFLVKQNNETTALRIDLVNLSDLWAILANDSKNLGGIDRKWK